MHFSISFCVLMLSINLVVTIIFQDMTVGLRYWSNLWDVGNIWLKKQVYKLKNCKSRFFVFALGASFLTKLCYMYKLAMLISEMEKRRLQKVTGSNLYENIFFPFQLKNKTQFRHRWWQVTGNILFQTHCVAILSAYYSFTADYISIL